MTSALREHIYSFFILVFKIKYDWKSWYFWADRNGRFNIRPLYNGQHLPFRASCTIYFFEYFIFFMIFIITSCFLNIYVTFYILNIEFYLCIEFNFASTCSLIILIYNITFWIFDFCKFWIFIAVILKNSNFHMRKFVDCLCTQKRKKNLSFWIIIILPRIIGTVHIVTAWTFPNKIIAVSRRKHTQKKQ